MKTFVTNLLFLIGFMLISPNAWARNTYCCSDSSGHSFCSDVMPAACYDKAYKVISPSGIVLRTVPAPLSSAELRKQEEQLQLQRQQERQKMESRRRDAVIMETYTSVAEIDSRRDRDVEQVTNDLNRFKARETELAQERAALEKIKADKASTPKMRQEAELDLTSIVSELTQIRTLVAAKNRDIETLKQRYAQDRARFIELKQAEEKP